MNKARTQPCRISSSNKSTLISNISAKWLEIDHIPVADFDNNVNIVTDTASVHPISAPVAVSSL